MRAQTDIHRLLFHGSTTLPNDEPKSALVSASILSVMGKERNQDDDWNRDAEKIE
jgi:hypothetical protein